MYVLFLINIKVIASKHTYIWIWQTHFEQFCQKSYFRYAPYPLNLILLGPLPTAGSPLRSIPTTMWSVLRMYSAARFTVSTASLTRHRLSTDKSSRTVMSNSGAQWQSSIARKMVSIYDVFVIPLDGMARGVLRSSRYFTLSAANSRITSDVT